MSVADSWASMRDAQIEQGLKEDAMAVGKTIMENKRGEWVPAIPMPLLGPRNKCLVCGAKFWTMDGYRGHYALKHIIDPEADDA